MSPKIGTFFCLLGVGFGLTAASDAPRSGYKREGTVEEKGEDKRMQDRGEGLRNKASRDAFDGNISHAMFECLQDATSDKDKRACKEKARMAIADEMGINISQADLDAKLWEKGSDEAGRFMKECMAKMSTKDEKAKCMKDDKAKELLSIATGKPIEDITDTDLAMVKKKDDIKSITAEMKDCMRNTTDKQLCFDKGDDFKERIVGARGGDKDDIKDSEVRGYMERGSKHDMLESMKSCTLTKEECIYDAKVARAEALGKDPENITDLEWKRDSKDAIARDLSIRMEACMDQAADADAKTRCKSEVAKACMKEGDLDGKDPTDAEVERALQAGAKMAALDLAESCEGSDEECYAQLKTKVAKAQGMDEDEISDYKVKTVVKNAYNTALKDEVYACKGAKEANEDASCEGLYEKKLRLQGKGKPSDEKRAATDKKRVEKDAATETAANAKRICYAMDDKAAAQTCLEEAKKEMEGLDDVIYGRHASADVKEKKRKQASKDADIEVVGDMFSACMKAAEDEDGKNACKTSLKAKSRYVEGGEDSDSLMKRYNAKKLAEPSASCEADEIKQCRKQAKQDVIDAGLPKNEYASVKRLGEIKSAATVWSLCKEAGSDDDTCHSQARDEYVLVSGATEDSYDDEVKAKVEGLGNALLTGDETELRKSKEVEVELDTSGSSCDEAIEDNLVSKVNATAKKIQDKFRSLKKKGCRVVDDSAGYRSKIDGRELTDQERFAAPVELADTLSADTAAIRRLKASSFRRLEEADITITDAYAAEAIEECGVGDAACGQAEVTDSETGDRGGGNAGASVTLDANGSSSSNSTGADASDVRTQTDDAFSKMFVTLPIMAVLLMAHT